MTKKAADAHELMGQQETAMAPIVKKVAAAMSTVTKTTNPARWRLPDK